MDFWLWLLSKDEYVALPSMLSWVNWVDLGFIGVSFMGGILMVICWIRLLLLNMTSIPVQYKYLAAFSLFLIGSTLTLNTAFADNAMAVQAFALYFGSHVKINKKRV